IALYYGDALIGEQLEPWFMIASGVLVLGIALWMSLQMRRSASSPHDHHHHAEHVHDGAHHHHDHGHHHDHDHHEDHDHHHAHAHLDAHALAHAREIETRLAAGKTSTFQTILFGLSGGLIPCPAAITVFLLCLHLGKVALGITLVSAFSIGLALTLVLVGAVAALGLREISRRTSRLNRLFDAAPYLSVVLITVIGLLMIYSGWHHLDHLHA
ncbi:MAG: nickel/cobalt efflux transporter, partial [Pseudomonadota bacterium]